MEVKVDNRAHFTLIEVREMNLDSLTAPDLKTELVVVSGKGEKNMVIDLTHCQTLDSSGLSALLVADRLCKNSQGMCVLTGLNESMLSLIRLSYLDVTLRLAGSVEEAEAMIMSVAQVS
jgi:anti-sigma B factor antagonist